MTIWKKQMLSRLHNPTDGEGADLGGSLTEAAIDAIGVDAPDATSAEGQPSDPPADEPLDIEPPADEQPASESKPGSRMAAMLDSLTDDPNAPKPKTEGEKPAEAVAKVEPGKPSEAKAPEAEEAELLDGVKSERGKERIKQVFAERKQLEQDLNEFRQLVQSTGMTAQDFAQSLEFGRLVNSGDDKNLRVALEMIEGQRAAMYQRLGVEAPGIDLLAGQDDLKRAVDGMEITRDKAVELAKYRKQQAEATQRQQVQLQTQQDQQAFQQTVQQAAGTMDAYLQTRANEVDHMPRMKALTEHFKNPANLQSFVSTYRPEQWAATVKMMYDGIQLPRAAASAPQPIRARSANLGTPAASAAMPIDRIAQRMEAMGL